MSSPLQDDIMILPGTSPMRRTALYGGVLYLLTFATSIPTLILYQPVRDHANFVLGAGSATSVTWGAGLEVALAVTCVGTAVVLFPVVKRPSETAAVGFLAARLVEACLILLGVIAMTATLSLRHNLPHAASLASSQVHLLLTAQKTLLAVYDWAFLLGQSLMPVFSAVFLGSALYASGLVPRIIPTIGLVGAPLLLVSDVLIFIGAIDPRGGVAGIAALPIAVWEFTLGVWLIMRGFRSTPPLQP